MRCIVIALTRTGLRFSFSILFTAIIGFSNNGLLAQNNLADLKGSTSLMGQFWGIESVGFNLSHNINHRVSINGGLGVLLDYHLGTNFYLTDRRKKKSSFYLGVQIGSVRQVSIFGSSDESQLGIYVPLGFEYISSNGFTFQIDIGPNFVKEDWAQINTYPFLGSLKIGYTFKKKS